MPKTASFKVLRREDYAYTPTASLSKSALNTHENGSTDIRKSSSTKLIEETVADIGEIIPRSNNLQVEFPRDDAERQKYRTKAGKKITQYQWDVYDFILQIPKGKVTTYKIISERIGGSARSAGGALKINPFSPYVPCHRVVASNLFIGGFFGQWAGRESSKKTGVKKEQNEQSEIQTKISLLKQEGVDVDARGFLVNQEVVVWRPAQNTKLDNEEVPGS